MALKDPCLEALASAPDLPPPGAPLLVACSGGADSMALVQACLMLNRWVLHVATVDHGLHPDAPLWAEQVRSFWARRGVSAQIYKVALGEGADLEARARAARYEALEVALLQSGAAVGLTAHTAQDQAETILMRLASGAGLRGLAGIPARRGVWRRPWLNLQRATVWAFAQRHGLPLIEDPANRDARFVRSHLRQRAFPVLNEVLGPQWVLAAARSAQLLREALAREEWLLEDWWRQLRGARGTGLSLRLEMLRAAPGHVRRWALTRALQGHSGRRIQRQIEALELVVSGERQAHELPLGWRAWRGGAWLVIDRPAPALEAIPVGGVGQWATAHGALRLSARPQAGAARLAWPPEAPLILRGCQEGDVWGGPGGRRSLGRALRDAGVGAPDRPAWPLLASQGEILWVAGLGLSQRGHQLAATAQEAMRPVHWLSWQPSGA